MCVHIVSYIGVKACRSRPTAHGESVWRDAPSQKPAYSPACSSVFLKSRVCGGPAWCVTFVRCGVWGGRRCACSVASVLWDGVKQFCLVWLGAIVIPPTCVAMLVVRAQTLALQREGLDDRTSSANGIECRVQVACAGAPALDAAGADGPAWAPLSRDYTLKFQGRGNGYGKFTFRDGAGRLSSAFSRGKAARVPTSGSWAHSVFW